VIIFVSDNVYYDLHVVRRMILDASVKLHVPPPSEDNKVAASSGCAVLAALLGATLANLVHCIYLVFL
jgi:hypothetical protein